MNVKYFVKILRRDKQNKNGGRGGEGKENGSFLHLKISIKGKRMQYEI